MLNTKLTDTMTVDMPLSDALALCRRAVADIGWRVLEQGASRIRCKEVAVSAMSFNWPAEVDIILSSIGPSQTTILLNGSVFGVGPIQKNHLLGQMGNLRNRIELANEDRHSKAPTVAAGSLSGELEKLAALRKNGILTDEEFTKAKQRLLEKSS